MKCPTCELCEYEQYCGATEIMRKCERHNKKVDMTNKEYIRTCSTEELEHALTMLIMKDRFFADKEFAYVNIRFGVHCWLKEKHEH